MAGRYVLSLITAALIGGILTGLLPGSSCGKALKLLCGIFLMAAVLRPLGSLTLPDLDTWLESWDREAEAAARVGEDYLQAQKRQVISQRLEAYILDKAEQLGAQLTAKVTLDGQDCPEAVTLEGTWSQTQQEQLRQLLETELGIPKERQQWQESGSSGRNF